MFLCYMSSFNQEHCSGPLPNGYEGALQYHQIKLNQFHLGVDSRDSCIMTKYGGPYIICNILKLGIKMLIVAKKFTKVQNLFDFPLPSANLGIVKASNLSSELHVFDPDQILSKCVFLLVDHQSEEQFAIYPLLHC